MPIEDEIAESTEEELAAAAESSTTETETETTDSDDTTKSGENRIPQERFNKVNDAFKDAKAAGDLASQQLAESQSAQLELQKMLAAKEEDVKTLNEIKSYINDPTMEEHVLAIDRRLKGIEEEVETGELDEEEALERTRRLLDATKEEVLDVKADVQAEALVTKADIIADKLLDSLPDEYNEQDRGVIADLWTEKMDWDAAVADPDNLSGILTETFQETLNRYGTPRGALFTEAEVEENTTETTPAQTPQEELAGLMGKDWGAVKEVNTKGGGTKVEPVLSNDEFNAALATAMRHARQEG